ncbi:hypothetical protein HWV62_30687 [Athelia sp. TMB]|nr:hypothetical protein HWV62_30687 [Athelia sp. TMB]
MLPSFPALYLYPLNADSFVKHINLTNNRRVKIGRQTNARTVPAENNGYFDLKVLSRQHAEVWEENNKIFIKDVKSSNGTFINGERLSPEGLESEPYELKEDNKTVIHHKVAARVAREPPLSRSSSKTSRAGMGHSSKAFNGDPFVKHINLTNNQRVKIGRQTNAR